jgi:hypothetical protein
MPSAKLDAESMQWPDDDDLATIVLPSQSSADETDELEFEATVAGVGTPRHAEVAKKIDEPCGAAEATQWPETEKVVGEAQCNPTPAHIRTADGRTAAATDQVVDIRTTSELMELVEAARLPIGSRAAMTASLAAHQQRAAPPAHAPCGPASRPAASASPAASAAPPAAVEAGGGVGWACTRCTFLNSGLLRACELCGGVRSASEPTPASAAASAAAALPDSMSESPPSPPSPPRARARATKVERVPGRPKVSMVMEDFGPALSRAPGHAAPPLRGEGGGQPGQPGDEQGGSEDEDFFVPLAKKRTTKLAADGIDFDNMFGRKEAKGKAKAKAKAKTTQSSLKSDGGRMAVSRAGPDAKSKDVRSRAPRAGQPKRARVDIGIEAAEAKPARAKKAGGQKQEFKAAGAFPARRKAASDFKLGLGPLPPVTLSLDQRVDSREVSAGGLRVLWPAALHPSRPQLLLMRHAAAALEGERHALLESPTGTGKTLALLCTTLAAQWARRQEAKAANQPYHQRVIYVSRTHAQLDQVFSTLLHLHTNGSLSCVPCP